ncbi:MAG: chaperone NapD [Planctomycetales bacterium]|nr:chaperone NapD [Planctomycetales bacterium]
MTSSTPEHPFPNSRSGGSPFAVVGVLLRTDDRQHELAAHLSSLDGVEVFSVEDPLRLGVVIEADTLQQAERMLREHVSVASGVLGSWPVYAHCEEDDDA